MGLLDAQDVTPTAPRPRYFVEVTELVDVVTVKNTWQGQEAGYVENLQVDQRRRQLLAQDLDTLDLAAVIKAVNGL